MPRSRRIAGVVAVLLGGWLLLAGSPVGAVEAASVDDIGWWSRTNQEPTLGGVLTPPTVTPGQLVVEGTAEGATAIAAIRATLPEGTGSPVLTLEVARETGGATAVLLACQAGSGWTGAHGGSWDAKPSPDCSQSVQGIPAEDGTTWSFALAPLQFGDQLDVVLTPGVDTERPEGLNGSSFRLVFERPSPASIEASESSGADESDFPAPDVDFGSPPPPSNGSSGSSGPGASSSPGFGGGSSGSSSFSIPVPPSEDELASQPARAALPAAEQGLTATAPVLSAQNPLETAAPVGDGADAGRAAGALVVLLGAGLLVWSSNQSVPERQVLSRFASAGPSTTSVVAASPTDEPVGGLGRFRRVRHTAARRLGG